MEFAFNEEAHFSTMHGQLITIERSYHPTVDFSQPTAQNAYSPIREYQLAFLPRY
jgi:hypothetical protein